MNAPLNLDSALNSFSKKHADLKIIPTIIDVTDCFYQEKTQKYSAPESFGDLNQNHALLYVILGAPLLTKYEKKNGKLVYENGAFKVKQVDEEYLAIATLCIGPLKNVALHEVYDALKDTNADEIQGFKKWALRNTIKKIKTTLPEFNEEKDTAFIFAGTEKDVLSAIKLNQIWLNQITRHGSRAREKITQEEAQLIKKLFSTNHAEQYYYQFQNITLPQTNNFIKNKLELAKTIN